MISVNQRSALSCSGRLGVWRKLQQTLVLSCSLPLALTLLTLCLCPKGVACFVQAALLLCINRCISASRHQGQEPWIGQTTDSGVGEQYALDGLWALHPGSCTALPWGSTSLEQAPPRFSGVILSHSGRGRHAGHTAYGSEYILHFI